jgi:hypothetical protein
MKKFLVLASVTCAAGFGGIIAAQFLGVLSFQVFTIPLLIGGAVASGLVGLICVDYSRRPRFCGCRARVAAALPRRLPASSAADHCAALWTYTTYSA